MRMQRIRSGTVNPGEPADKRAAKRNEHAWPRNTGSCRGERNVNAFYDIVVTRDGVESETAEEKKKLKINWMTRYGLRSPARLSTGGRKEFHLFQIVIPANDASEII